MAERAQLGLPGPDGAPLDLGGAACGDVVAARRWAKPLLAAVTGPAEPVRDAELILIAAGLQASGKVGQPGLSDVQRVVETLRPDAEGRDELARSPMQFVQFVAAELADMTPARLAVALELSRQAVSRPVR